ncbi:hypothetical protein KAS08_05000 [Candidatus Pacearchaeota archaeon]|nr:hypothetical protein [Candidatus Pacearchaeota archaeon]
MKNKNLTKKQRLHRQAWLIVLVLGGVLMLYGGLQDMLLFFAPGHTFVPSWHTASPIVGLVCGLIVMLSAGLNIVLGWQLRQTTGKEELVLAHRVVFVSAIGTVADWISGYYGFGSMVALIIGLWLIQNIEKK